MRIGKKTLVFSLLVFFVFFGLLNFLFLRNNNLNKDRSAVNIGYFIGVQSMPLIIGNAKGYFKGSGLDVNFVDLGRFRGMEIQLLGSGVLDCSDSPKFNAIQGVSMNIPVKLLTSFSQAEGNPVFKVIAKKESGIISIEDIKGKTIGFRKGGSVDFFVNKLLNKYKISKSEIEIIELDTAQAIAAFRAGKIDMFVADTLSIEEIRNDYELNILTDSADIMPNSYSEGFICRTDFIESHPQTVKKLLIAIYKTGKFINENPQQAKTVLKNLEYSPTWQKINFPPYALNNENVLDGLNEINDWLFSEGYIKNKVDINSSIYKL